MIFATINDLKHQLNIETDDDSYDTDDVRDSNLQLYLDASRERIETMLNLNLVESDESLTDEEKLTSIVYSNQIKIAHLLIASDWFLHREESQPTALSIIPTGAKAIISSIRKWNA